VLLDLLGHEAFIARLDLEARARQHVGEQIDVLAELCGHVFAWEQGVADQCQNQSQ
jgi:hypothetical protein